MLNYTVSEVISTLISIFPAIFGVLTGAGLVTVRKEKRTGNVAFTVIMAALAVMTILLYHDGILSKQEVDAYSEHTYFGQVKNNKPNGFGRLFDGEDRIYYCGNFKSGRITGKGEYYGFDEESKVSYVKYDGTFYKGWNEGHVIHNEYIAGEARPVFDANYKHGIRYGQGRECRYNDDGGLQYTYEGCFVNNVYWGYGVRTDYDKDGQISEKQDLFEKYPCPEELFWK